MGHLGFGAQLIDRSSKFDLRVDATSDTSIQANEVSNDPSNDGYGVGAILFSSATECEDVLIPITNNQPTVTKTQKATGQQPISITNPAYQRVTFQGSDKDMYLIKVSNILPSSDYTITYNHIYQIPANTNSVVLDVQFKPIGNRVTDDVFKDKDTVYTIQIGN